MIGSPNPAIQGLLPKFEGVPIGVAPNKVPLCCCSMGYGSLMFNCPIEVF